MGTFPNRFFVGLFLFVVTACGHASESAPAVDSSASAACVQTTSGPIAGYTDGDVAVYKGIPYAVCERFMPPTGVVPWKQPRSCRAYGPVAMQAPRTGWWFDPMAFWFDWDDGFQSENCLNLNVWTSTRANGRPRPVMVWLHGGGFAAGSSHELPSYDGRALAATGDVVVVSVNHRLNVLGFLDLSSCGVQYAQSGNVGMLDIVAALQWVHDNINRFDGDPENVTVFGQSGGGGKVTALMAMPAAEGLFHKAIVQSGSMNKVMTRRYSSRIGERTLRELGLKSSEVEKLTAVPYAELLAAGERAVAAVKAEAEQAGEADSFLFGWMPTVDGDVLPAHPFDPEASAISAKIPMIIGTTVHEFLGESLLNPALQHISLDDARARLSKTYGDRTDTYIKTFAEAYPDFKPRDLFDTDLRFRPQAVAQAAAKARQGEAPVYMYLFTWESPAVDGMFRSFHCVDLPFVFDNVDLCRPMTGGTDAARALARKMSCAWIAFARNGKPAAAGLPEWPAYDEAAKATMQFDDECRILYGHDADWLRVATERNSR